MDHERPAESEQPDIDEPSYFNYSATLRIFGRIPDLDDLTRNLGVRPSHSHRADERRSPVAQPYKHDMRIYEAPVREAEPLHVHIDTLWETIREHKRYLLDLKRDLTVDVFLGYRSNSDNAGVEVPYQSLEMFLELQVPFGLSIIIT
jgi:hypothetical protein